MSETGNEMVGCGGRGGGRPRRRLRPWLAAAMAVLTSLALVAGACGSDGEADTESSEDSFGAERGELDGDDAGGGVDDSGDSVETEGEAMAEEAEDMADEEAPAADADADPVATDDAVTDDVAAEDAATGASEAGSSGSLGAGGATVTPSAADLGRKLIFTAYLTVGVDDVSAAGAEATRIIEDLGGFVFGQNTEGGAEPVSELTFKILPADFNRALEALGSVGELRNQSVTTDDVTERVVDLESRVEVAQLGVERLRAALENAGTLEDYAEIERLLLDRESELEVMRGQLRTLEDRIDLATITLVLTQDRVENQIDVAVTSYDGHDGGRGCPGEQGLDYEQEAAVTVCFEIVNLGDQTLTDIVLTDTALDIDADNSASELIPVFGSIDELAPGQSVLLAHEANPERTLRLRTRVTAVPTDGVSPEPAGPAVNTQVDSLLETFPSEENPGFTDGFGVAVDVLQWLWVALTVTVGFLIPLLVLVPFLGLIWMGLRAWRRRRPPRPSRPAGGPGGWGGPGGNQPPPPPSPAQTAAPTAQPTAPTAQPTAPTAQPTAPTAQPTAPAQTAAPSVEAETAAEVTSTD